MCVRSTRVHARPGYGELYPRIFKVLHDSIYSLVALTFYINFDHSFYLKNQSYKKSNIYLNYIIK
jgi:hypothetical protein